MNSRAICVLILIVCASCNRNETVRKSDLSGEWQFTYVQKARTAFGMNPSPPMFDLIEFKKDNSIHLVDSMRKREFNGKFTYEDGILEWEFSPEDMPKPIVHRVDCLWAEKRKSIILRLSEGETGSDLETEWVYFRPEYLLPNAKMIGKWMTSNDGESTDMIFQKDGTFLMNNNKIWGYYRLWPSRYGDALTTAIWIQGEGGFMLLYSYSIESDTLTLTPLTYNGPLKDNAISLSRATEPVSSVPSMPVPN